MATSGFESAIDEHIERHININGSSPEKAKEDGEGVDDSTDRSHRRFHSLLRRPKANALFPAKPSLCAREMKSPV